LSCFLLCEIQCSFLLQKSNAYKNLCHAGHSGALHNFF
jgi:hypothetical protein